MSQSNGQIQKVQEERQRERQHQQQLKGLQFDDNGQLTEDTIEALVDTDELQDETVATMKNYLTRNWILGNLNDAQEHDFWYKMEVMKYKVFAAHPPEGSLITGATRAFLLDDRQEYKEPLTADERNLIDSFFDSLKIQLTRSREGFEREMLSKQVRESRTGKLNEESEETGGIRGLFSR